MAKGSRPGKSFMYFDIKRMRTASKRRTGCLRGLLRTSLLAEVKRQGFYEAVTADKVSFSPHRRVYSA